MTDRQIVVRLPLLKGTTEHDPRCEVQFPVRPPTFITAADDATPGARVRLIDDEGQISVSLRGGGIEVRGRHSITIEPTGANSVLIFLRDADEDDDPA